MTVLSEERSTDPKSDVVRERRDQADGRGQDGDLSDLLNEMRVLLPGATTLTAFLIILPFNGSFAEIRNEERVVYVITFLCSILSLIFFTAPAAQHRLQRPLRDREGFKTYASRLVILGLIPMSVALVLSTQLVMSQVVSWRWFSWAMAAIVALGIAVLWWIVPVRRHDRLGGPRPHEWK